MEWAKTAQGSRSLCKEAEQIAQADQFYEKLKSAGIEVLYDDRADLSAGVKFAEADLIGIPLRVVVSQKTLAQNGVEVKQPAAETTEIIGLDRLVDYCLGE